MRSSIAVAMVAVCVLALGFFATAEVNKFGVADTQVVSFDNPIYVGGVLLPKGSYEVKHAMQGQDHIMLFTQLKAKHPVEARTKCSLVPLPQKANQTEKLYVFNQANQRVLQELVFRGDTAKHVF